MCGHAGPLPGAGAGELQLMLGLVLVCSWCWCLSAAAGAAVLLACCTCVSRGMCELVHAGRGHAWGGMRHLGTHAWACLAARQPYSQSRPGWRASHH